MRPLEAMGAYIPAGRYPLPSTLMMTVIPAQVAGVKNICVACPHPALKILGVRAVARVHAMFPNGRRAGHRGICLWNRDRARVDRIVGPGNIYVAAAKKLLAGEVGIDFVAGPTEIVIIADDGNPSWIAADMLAQAEHDMDASAILLTTSRSAGRSGCERSERAAAKSAHRRGGASGDRRKQRDRDPGPYGRSRGHIQSVRARASQRCTILRCSPKIHHAGGIFPGRGEPGGRGRLRLRSQPRLPTAGARACAAASPLRIS